MASEREMEALRKQVALQCRSVAHMARALAGVQEDKGRLFEAGHLDTLLHFVGEQTAEQMEILGDILNGMDAVSDEDDWLTPVFEEAQRRFPTNSTQEPTPDATHLREVNAALVDVIKRAQMWMPNDLDDWHASARAALAAAEPRDEGGRG